MFTWSQGESLEDLSRAKRVIQIKDDHRRRLERMRARIQTQLEQGRDEAEILAYFQERYGDWILQDPPKRGPHLLVWLLPAGAALLGLASLVVFVRRWRRAAEVPVEVDEADLERVRAALDRG